MKKNIQVLLLAVFFSFLWGVWWSHYRAEQSMPASKRGPEIRVLALKGVFPEKFVKEFSNRHSFNITVTEKNSDGDLLREALSNNSAYDLIQISSFISKSFIIDNVFMPLDMEEIPNFSNVSVDFKNLEFDLDNHYFTAISWGLNGFIINAKKISLQDESLNEILNVKSAFSVLPSPVELFNLSIKLKPIIKNWVETGQSAELKKDLRELKNPLGSLAQDPREKLTSGAYDLAQITSGFAATLLGRDSVYRFVLPKERGTLWLNLIGVSRGARDKDLAFDVINQLLSDESNLRLVRANEQASPLATLNSSDLPLLQKASFIRQVPLSRVELFINHEALESTWLEGLREQWPNL